MEIRINQGDKTLTANIPNDTSAAKLLELFCRNLYALNYPWPVILDGLETVIENAEEDYKHCKEYFK